MTTRLQLIIAILIIAALVFLIRMVRKGNLQLRYTLSWIIVGIGILIFDAVPSLMWGLANIMGVEKPVNMLFFMGFIFVLGLVFVLTVSLSHNSEMVRELTQQMGIMEKSIRELKDQIDSRR